MLTVVVVNNAASQSSFTALDCLSYLPGIVVIHRFEGRSAKNQLGALAPGSAPGR